MSHRQNLPTPGQNIFVTWYVYDHMGYPHQHPFEVIVRSISPKLKESPEGVIANATLEYLPTPTSSKEVHEVTFHQNNTVRIVYAPERNDTDPCPWSYYTNIEHAEESDEDCEFLNTTSNDPKLTLSEMNEKYLNLEGRFLALQSNLSQLSDRILPQLHDTTKHRSRTVLELALFYLAHDMSTKSRKHVKVVRSVKISQAGPRHVTIGAMQRTYTEVTIPTTFAVYQEICRNAYALLSDKAGHEAHFFPSYPESLSSLDPTSSYAITFDSAYGLFKTLVIQRKAACKELLITTKTHLRVSGTFVANPDKEMAHGILMLGRTWNGAFPKDNCLSRDDPLTGHKFPILAMDSTEFLPEENRFRMPFWLYDMAELEREGPSNILPEEITHFSYLIKWSSCRRLKKTFAKVSEILPEDFGILSVSVPNILVNNEEMVRNITKLCTPKVLDKVLAGIHF